MFQEAVIECFVAGAAFGAAAVTLNKRSLKAMGLLMAAMTVSLMIVGAISAGLGLDIRPSLMPWVATSMIGAILSGVAIVALSSVATWRSPQNTAASHQ